MPLKKAPKGASKAERRKIASEDIREMRKAGHPENQSVAAGLRAAGLSRKGGGKRGRRG